jgi:hypothetical protein
LESCINQNATSVLDQSEYNQNYEKYFRAYEREKYELESLQNLKVERKTKARNIKNFIDKIKGKNESTTTSCCAKEHQNCCKVVTDCCAEECQNYYEVMTDCAKEHQNCYEIVTEFRQELFFAMIEKITVSSDRILTFAFENGLKLKFRKLFK